MELLWAKTTPEVWLKFCHQAYKEAQKPSPMELIQIEAIWMAEDPATFKPPKMDIPVIEGKKKWLQIHNL